jgi:DNA/RNA endonuclease YhcR with UshA esterase domain
MNDNVMFRIALTTTVIGIIGMILFSGQIGPKELHIKDIDRGMLDEEVSISGVADNIKESTSTQTYYLEVADNTGKIDIIIFNKNAKEYEKYNLKIKNLVNMRIKVKGTVTEYDGHLELILKDAKSLQVLM